MIRYFWINLGKPTVRRYEMLVEVCLLYILDHPLMVRMDDICVIVHVAD